MAVNPLALDFVNPALHDRVELRLEQIELGLREHDVLVACLHRDGEPANLGVRPDLADRAYPRFAIVFVERLLHVGRQLRPGVLVHRDLEGGGAEAHVVRPLDLILGHVLKLERRDDLPGDKRAVDHLFRKRLRQRGHGHRHCGGTERLDDPGAGARRDPHLEALQVVRLAHQLLGHLDALAGMHVQEHHLDALEVVGDRAVVEHVAHRKIRRRRVVGMHEGELKHLGAREQTWGVAVHRPDDVDHAVAHLVDQLGRLAAEGHRREDLDLDLATRGLLDVVRPGDEHFGMRRRLRAEQVVELERDLRLRRARRQCQTDCGREAADDMWNHFHFFPPPSSVNQMCRWISALEQYYPAQISLCLNPPYE